MNPSHAAPDPRLLPEASSEERLAADVRWLREFAAHIVRDPALADDACQEAWLGALQGEGAPLRRKDLAQRAWRFLFRHWRGERRRRVRENEAKGKSEAPSVDDLLVQHEQQQRLWTEMVNLEEPYRSTLLLRFQGELDTGDIAAKLGLQRDTVRWRIREGIARMRDRLARDEERGGLAAIALFSRRSVQSSDSHGLVVSMPAVSIPVASAAGLIMTKYIAACALLVAALAAAMFLQRPVASASPGPAPTVSPVQTASLASLVEAPLESPSKGRVVLEEVRPEEPQVAAPKAAIRQPPPAILRLTINGANGARLPPTATVTVLPYADGYDYIDEEVQVTVSTDVKTTEIELPVDLREWIEELGEIDTGVVDVKAAGFGRQSSGVVPINWKQGGVSDVTVELQPAHRVRILCVREGTRDAVEGVKVALEGPSTVFRPHYGARDTSPIDLLLVDGGDVEDWLFIEGKATALRRISRSQLLALPVLNGVRHVELPTGHTLRGRVEMASGLPIPEGAELHYSELSRASDGTLGRHHVLVHRDGRVAIEEDGWFEIRSLTPGPLRLHLREEGRMRFNTRRFSHDYDVEIPRPAGDEFQVVVPEELWTLAIDLSWRDQEPYSQGQLVKAKLYRTLGDTDLPYSRPLEDRELVATSDLISGKIPGELVLPIGAIEDGVPYIVAISGSQSFSIERRIVFHGPRPEAKIRLTKSSRLELDLPPLPTDTDAEGRAAATKAAREEGASVLIEARTPE